MKLAVPCSFLVACVVLVACGEPQGVYDEGVYHPPCDPIAVSIDGTLGDERSAALEQAIAWWNEVDVPFYLDTSSDQAGSATITVGAAEAAPVFFGHYDVRRDLVLVNTAIDEPRAVAVVLAHELGHAIGMEHVSVEERSSVMNHGNLDVIPLATDAASVRSSWACPPQE